MRTQIHLRTFALLMVGMLLLAACAQEEVVIPTLIPTPTPEVIEAPVEVEQPTAAPTDVPVDRPTLPPTWTPTDEPSPTAIPTQTPDPTIEELISVVETDECRDFGEDAERNPNEVFIGAPITVFWIDLPTAFEYEVTLFDQRGFPIHQGTTEEASYTFPEDLFEGNQLYGWHALPRDFNSVPRCPPRGGEFRTLVPSTG